MSFLSQKITVLNIDINSNVKKKTKQSMQTGKGQLGWFWKYIWALLFLVIVLLHICIRWHKISL